MAKARTLTTKQRLFVDEYIIDFNGTQAAIRAGYSEKTAQQQASRLLLNVVIQNAIDEAIADRRKRLRIDADTVLFQWWQIANADPNELTQLRRFNCRYCWGDDHEYQWTPKQYERACLDAQKDDQPEPYNLGGSFYDRKRPPHPDCPECSGDGTEDVYFADTTKLSPQAKLLYQSVEQTKFGVKINMADQMKALDNVARHLGMFKDTVNHVSEDGSMSSKPTVIRLMAPKVDENGRVIK